MRIIHVNEVFSPLSETSIYGLIVGLAQAGHESHVFTLRRVLENDRPHSLIDVIKLPPKLHPTRVVPSIQRRIGLIDAQEQLFSIARKQLTALGETTRPDLFHAHFGPMGVLTKPVAEKLGIPFVVFFGGYDITRLPRHKRWKCHYRELAHSVSAVICNSAFTAQRLLEIGFDGKRIVQAIGINIEDLPYRDPVLSFDGHRIECVFVGRLVEVKTPIPLIDAFAIARHELFPDYDLHLNIIGDGSLRQSVITYVEQGRHADYIHVRGPMPHDEVRTLFGKMHIYAQYNRRTKEGEEETLGGSLLEASASGLPIVAVRSGGIPEAVVDGRTGYLVEEGDIEGMAARIVELAQHPSLWTEFGRAGRAHVEANFTLDRQIAKTVELYESLLR